MELLPPELREQLPPLYSQESVKDPMVSIKFFHPNSHWTWYATEGSLAGDDFLFFGWVYGDFPELGYFSLAELEAFQDSLGMGIERDLHFTPMNLSEVKKLHPDHLTAPQTILVIILADDAEGQDPKQ